MGRRILAAVLASVWCVCARAAEKDVEFYGRLDADVEHVSAMGSTAVAGNPPVVGGYDKPPRNRVSSNSSYIGVRGSSTIRDDVVGYFQIESGLNQDTGTATTTSSSSTGISGTFASRNSALGIRGDAVGSLFVGTWETPYRTGFTVLDPFDYTGIGGFSILGNGHTTNPNSGNLVSFGRRQNNFLQYWLPALDGFTLKLGYSPNEERPATGNITAAMPSGYNPSLASASLSYSSPRLYGYLGYERHNDYTSVGRYDDGANAGGAYTIGALKLGVLYEQLHYRFGGAAQNVQPAVDPFILSGAVAAAAAGELRIVSWGMFTTYDLGTAGQIRVAYERAGNATGSALVAGASTGANKVTLGYGYPLSSQSEAYVVYTRINNHANGTYDFTTNLIGTAPTGGADPKAIGVGMRYIF